MTSNNCYQDEIRDGMRIGFSHDTIALRIVMREWKKAGFTNSMNMVHKKASECIRESVDKDSILSDTETVWKRVQEIVNEVRDMDAVENAYEE